MINDYRRHMKRQLALASHQTHHLLTLGTMLRLVGHQPVASICFGFFVQTLADELGCKFGAFSSG
jgi:hypothetical protein